MNQTLKDIYGRRSVRTFTDKQVDEAVLNEILKAGTYAATANNAQKWHFTVVKDQTVLDEVVEACKKSMLATGDPSLVERASDTGFHNFYHAPIVVVVSGETAFKHAKADCANAMQNMAVAAHSLGVDSCYIASFLAAMGTSQGPALKQKLDVPEGYEPFFALSLGYAKGDAPAAPQRKTNVISYVK